MREALGLPRNLKVAAGVVSVLAVAGLGFAFGPQIKPEKLANRPLVEQPVFVAASATSKPAVIKAAPVATPAPTTVAAVQPSVAAAVVASPALTRSITIVVPDSEASAACSQGLVALAKGDIGAARQWLARAADLGDARAMMALGDAYNPAILTRLGVIGAAGDPTRARDYYGRAIHSGLTAARDRLAALASAEN